MTKSERAQFARDFAFMLALSDRRKAEVAAQRERARSNPELVAELQRDAERRGQPGIDWDEYFRNVGAV